MDLSLVVDGARDAAAILHEVLAAIISYQQRLSNVLSRRATHTIGTKPAGAVARTGFGGAIPIDE
jgi:hypothetical protein